MNLASLLKTSALAACAAVPAFADGVPTQGLPELTQSIADMQFLIANGAIEIQPLEFCELYAFADDIKEIIVSDPQRVNVATDGHAMLIKSRENVTPGQVFVIVVLQDGSKIGLGDPSLMNNK